jgi:predicted Zn-dependent protease
MKLIIAVLATVLVASNADAQLGGILKRAGQVRDQAKSLTISEEDEQQIGAAVSDLVRQRYGVVQDPAVHKYVTLVGTALAQVSSRRSLPWQFIVLDTDGVNAFAAPGGYIHITRGALALARNEAELAGVLAHEITHVTEKHTISAIQKQKLVQRGSAEALKGNRALLNAYVDKTFELVYAGFGRAEELEADSKGVVQANQAGYAPASLGGFLTRLDERNKSTAERQGLFASHPEMKERLNQLAKAIADGKLASTATLAERYAANIAYELKEPQQLVAETKKGGFGLTSLVKPGSGAERKSPEVTASGGSRGVDTERLAKGGGNPALVAVTVSAVEIAAFKKEGGLR